MTHILSTSLPRQTALADPTPPPDRWWSDGAGRAIEHLAATGRPFGADELFDDPFTLPAPPHPSHVGAAFRAAFARHLIEPVGYRGSRRATRHGGVQRVWVGTPGVGKVSSR